MLREENNHKLCFNQADKAAINRKNMTFAYWSIQQLLFYTKINYSASPAALYVCQKSIDSFS